MVKDKEASIIEINRIKEDLAIFKLVPNDELVPQYKPGQFITIGMHVPSENRLVRRPYTLSSHPENREYLELYIRWMRKPTSGKITTQLFNTRVGDKISWLNPAGAFTINEKLPNGQRDERRIVCLGSGTGLAPFVSYAQHLHEMWDKREIIILHGASYVDELAYKELLTNLENESLDMGKDKWDFTYRATISRPNEKQNESWNGHKGRVETFLVSKNNEASDLEKLIGEKLTPENTTFYICGWQGTIDASLNVLVPKGFVIERKKRSDGSFEIKYESYGK